MSATGGEVSSAPSIGSSSITDATAAAGGLCIEAWTMQSKKAKAIIQSSVVMAPVYRTRNRPPDAVINSALARGSWNGSEGGARGGEGRAAAAPAGRRRR